MNVLIIDDEKPNRVGLAMMVKQYCPDFTVTGQAGSAVEARDFLNGNDVQVLLLDINMPNESGFELLSSINANKYQVVFITAYAEHAIRALRANAVDYLLKPIDGNDLRVALDNCRKRKLMLKEDAVMTASLYSDSLRNTIDDLALVSYPQKLTLPHKQGFKIVAVNQIVSLEASGNYTILYFENKEDLVVTRMLGDFEGLLDPQFFFRAHKSTILNLDQLAEYSSSDGHVAVMNNGQKLVISRRRLDDFMQAIDQRSKRI